MRRFAPAALAVLLSAVISGCSAGHSGGPPAPLAIGTASLPGATTGAVYSATLAATGGTTPYTWSISSGSLPAGLSLNASTGAISGTPSAAGSSSFTASVTDSSQPQQAASVALGITVAAAPPSLTVTTSALPGGTDGTSYSNTLVATGGATPYTWSISSGSLPAGLSLNAGTGAISGTPTSSGTFSFTAKVTDSSQPQQTASKALSITVAAAPPALAITTTSLPGGTTATSYSGALVATGGATPYTWSISSGALPGGLTLNSSTGAISGTPTSTGTFSFTTKAIDSSQPQQTASKALSVTVTAAPPALAITTTSLPGGTTGTSYSGTLVATGGATPYTWSISSGALPGGLTLNSSTGAISGTPTSAGTFSFTAKVTDSSQPQQTASKALSITIAAAPPPLSITTSALPGGTTGAAYSATLSATGGTTPYTWSISLGSLPSGLTLNANTGVISGTPTSTGTSSFTVKCTDSSATPLTATKALSIMIVAAPPPLTISTASLPQGTVGTAYTAMLVASGGTTPYTWTLTSGSLPAGLTLAPNGAISGSPSASGASPFTVQVADSSAPQQTVSKPFSITVHPAALAVVTTSLPGGTTGVGYSAGLAAAGGTAPYTWSIPTGALPAGLVLNTSTGAISGTPTGSGTSSFTAEVADSSSPLQTASQSLSITVTTIPPTLSITTTSLVSGTVGAAYSSTLVASGGASPYQWSVSGPLPAGLTLNAATGVISGTPTASGTSSFTVKITDASSPQQSASQALSISISPPAIVITTTSFKDGVAGTSYSAGVTATGGTSPYSWSIVGTLPAGLNLNAATGVIAGTPSVNGTFTFTVQVTDSGSPPQVTSKAFSIFLAVPLVVTTASLPDGITGSGYSATIAASGGSSPYQWSVSAGGLPAGLSLNAATGIISGTPTASGTSSFTVSVTDSAATPQTAVKPFSIVVSAPLAISTGSLPGGTTGASYSSTLAETGGTTPYTWSVSLGSLPGGLTLNASTGVISGTPAATGTFSFTAQVSDSSAPQQTASKALSITVVTPLAVSTGSLPGGTTGTSYSSTLAETGGTAPYTWSISVGSLPRGLTLNTSTGGISGTPTAAGTFSFTAKVADASQPQLTASKALSITVAAAPPVLTITTSSLPDGTNGTSYSGSLVATGGATPYLWTISSGSLPNGLTLNSSSGAISGTPTANGAFSFTAQVSDSSSPQQSTSEPLSITISSSSSPISVACDPNPLEGETQGGNYVDLPTCTQVNTGDLLLAVTTTYPASPQASLVTGVRDSQGDFFQPVQGARCTDASGGVDLWYAFSKGSQSNGMTVNVQTGMQVEVTTGALPSVGASGLYAYSLQALGGTAPYTWSIGSGALPSGLSLSSLGTISGIGPSSAGTANFTVQVVDSSSPPQTATAALSISTVSSTPPLVITSTLIPFFSVNPQVAYSSALLAAGGIPPYTWTVISGSLPPGLNLDSTGLISGTPAPEVYVQGTMFTVQVTDSSLPVQIATAQLALNTPFTAGFVLQASGVNSTQPVDQVASLSNQPASTSITSPSITNPVSGDLVVAANACAWLSSIITGGTPGFTFANLGGCSAAFQVASAPGTFQVIWDQDDGDPSAPVPGTYCATIASFKQK